MTIRELSEHPENANVEELKAFVDCVCLMEEMGKQIEPLINGVTMESGRTKEEIAYSYYVETMLMSAILESFVTSSVQEYKGINKFVFNYTDKELFWDMPVTTYYKCLAKLCKVGLLELTKDDNYNPSFAITEDGLLALRQQTYSNLAQSALFNLKTQQLNDQTLELSKRAVKQNRMMLVVAVASVIVAIFSLIIALIK